VIKALGQTSPEGSGYVPICFPLPRIRCKHIGARLASVVTQLEQQISVQRPSLYSCNQRVNPTTQEQNWNNCRRSTAQPSRPNCLSAALQQLNTWCASFFAIPGSERHGADRQLQQQAHRLSSIANAAHYSNWQTTVPNSISKFRPLLLSSLPGGSGGFCRLNNLARKTSKFHPPVTCGLLGKQQLLQDQLCPKACLPIWLYPRPQAFIQ